jgi:hypothetical protein
MLQYIVTFYFEYLEKFMTKDIAFLS